MAGEFGAAVPKTFAGCLRGVPGPGPCSLRPDALERVDNYLYQRRFVNGLIGAVRKKTQNVSGAFTRSLAWDRSERSDNSMTSSPRRSSAIADAQDYYENVGRENASRRRSACPCC